MINFRSHQFIEVLQKRSDVLYLRMSTITRHRPHLQVCLMQSLQIINLLPAPHHNHRIVMASQDKVHHQTGDTAITVLKRVDTDISVVE